jgi:hypothetical protein
MKRRRIVGAAMAVVLILSVAWFARGAVAAQDKPAAPVQKWEYKLVKVLPTAVSESEASLNKLGSEGWELCATVVPFRRVDEEYVVSFIKRPKR